MPKVLADARDQLLLACGLSAGDEGWQQFMQMANELWPKINQPTLTPLLRRAGEADDAKSSTGKHAGLVVNRPRAHGVTLTASSLWSRPSHLVNCSGVSVMVTLQWPGLTPSQTAAQQPYRRRPSRILTG